MSLYAYTVFSIVVIIGFIIANYHYGLPLWTNIGLVFSLVMCVKGLI